MISCLESYSKIIASYEIRRYRQYGKAYEFIAMVYFTNCSELYIHDYLFLNGVRKYAFHWQDNKLNLLRRWDNSAYHQHIATFPYHIHTPKGIEESMPMTLRKVLEYINKQYPFKTL